MKTSSKLQKEIRQKKPFRSVEAEAYLDLVRTAGVLARQVDLLLKPYGLTATQYNVLRILRGVGEDGATCTSISERMINSDPDVTRLLDRMEKAGLITRTRSRSDRRVVLTKLAPPGLKLLARLDREIDNLHVSQFQGMSKKAISELIDRLDALRAAAAE